MKILKLNILLGLLVILTFGCFSNKIYAQEVSENNYHGQWTDDDSWVDESAPALLNLGAVNITINGYIQVGTSSSPDLLTFAANSEGNTLTINDTLVVFGDVTFANKAMNLNLGDGAVVVIFGDLSMDNKITMSSSGTLIVTGTFDKSGTQGSFTGDGNVYAGSFTGDAAATIDDGGGDSSFPIEQLSDDGFDEIEDFTAAGGIYILPIELTYFNAYNNETSITLNWQTASEENNDYFTLERSADGINYEVIGSVLGAGNSSVTLNYSYTDNNPVNGVSYYRLTQTDYNGDFEVFSPVSVSFLNEGNLEVYPNPAINEFNISMAGSMGRVSINLYSIIGTLVKSIETDNNYTTIDVSDLPSGYYMMVILANNSKITKKVIIQ